MTDVALVLCSGTLPAATPLLERIEVAAQAGFDGLSLWGRDHEAAIAGGSTDAALRSAFATAGIGVAEVDGAWGWTPGAPALGRGIDPFLDHDEASLFAIAEGLGGRSVNAVDIFGGDGTLAEMATAFGSLCDRAADHGLLVHLEALPWSRVPTVREAMAVVERAGRDNGGVLVDAWHLFRGHAAAADALAAVRSLDGSRVFAVQLADGAPIREPDLLHAALHDRRLPGAGSFDLVGLVRALDAIGSAAPIGVEVFSDELATWSPAAAAHAAAEATRSVLAQARTAEVAR